MELLIAHLFGDYCLQNHWMANNKTKKWLPAIIHAALYSLPFLLITQSAHAMSVIFGTHLLIDRFRLASYWQEFWGVGCSGTLWEPKNRREIKEGYNTIYYHDTGEPNPKWEDAPPWLKTWLLIIIDNTIHMTINYLCVTYL